MNTWTEILWRFLAIFLVLACLRVAFSQPGWNDISTGSMTSILLDPVTLSSLFLLTVAIIVFRRIRQRTIWGIALIVLIVGGSGTLFPGRFSSLVGKANILPVGVTLIVLLVLWGVQGAIRFNKSTEVRGNDADLGADDDKILTIDLK